MSTSSYIGLAHDDGTITSVYCHWDGHIETNGRILVTHYTTAERVGALLALGALSELGPEIGEQHDFAMHDTHSDWCLAYGRDRGEAGTEPLVWANEESCLDFARIAGAEYVYLFRDGTWLAYSGRTAAWYSVADALAENDERPSRCATTHSVTASLLLPMKAGV